MPISISPAGTSKVGVPAAGIVHAESATPIERRPLAARVVTATTSSSDRPASAAAPATL